MCYVFGKNVTNVTNIACASSHPWLPYSYFAEQGVIVTVSAPIVATAGKEFGQDTGRGKGRRVVVTVWEFAQNRSVVALNDLLQ